MSTFLSRLIGSAVLLVVLVAGALHADSLKAPPRGPFGLGLVKTADGAPADLDFLFDNELCAACHERQFKEFHGSFHSASHTDPLYRHFAELAREEAGAEVYTFCASCHAPAGVITGQIPDVSESELPDLVKAGVTCDSCHQISALAGTKGPWGEEANASFVMHPGLTKFGPSGQVTENRLHKSEQKKFFATSEFCASCHTVIHPTNGFRIENTYAEWKKGPYAAHGIQCQDCHMRSIEDAVRVAKTMKPVVVSGPSANGGPSREIFPHYFVGANADAGLLANGPEHAAMTVARLKSAAKIEVTAPDRCDSGSELRFGVTVHNVAAGHNIPTGVTELRQMWVDLTVVDDRGSVIYRSGQLHAKGEFGSGTIWFGAIAGDAEGKRTHKLWEVASFLWHRTIAPKGSMTDTVKTVIPPSTLGPVTIQAKLLYRSASPQVVAEVMHDDAFAPSITEMASTTATVAVD